MPTRDMDNMFKYEMGEKYTTKINRIKKDANKFMYAPITKHSNIKTLTIMACHATNSIKYNTIINNLRFFVYKTNDIIVINSTNTEYGEKIALFCKHHNLVKSYIEIPNNPHLDMGKWAHVLSTNEYTSYNFVILTNDSYFMLDSITPFYNKIITKNLQLYGYNDSNQIRYHYQSYLFALRKDAIPILISHYNKVKPLLTDYLSVVSNIELRLTTLFKYHDCFLKIANYYGHHGKNIFFNNDKLYIILVKLRLLPFFKLKRNDLPRQLLKNINH